MRLTFLFWQVLEYLALREILTLEHINGGPPCPGMERSEKLLTFLLLEFITVSFRKFSNKIKFHYFTAFFL